MVEPLCIALGVVVIMVHDSTTSIGIPPLSQSPANASGSCDFQLNRVGDLLLATVYSIHRNRQPVSGTSSSEES